MSILGHGKHQKTPGKGHGKSWNSLRSFDLIEFHDFPWPFPGVFHRIRTLWSTFQWLNFSLSEYSSTLLAAIHRYKFTFLYTRFRTQTACSSFIFCSLLWLVHSSISFFFIEYRYLLLHFPDILPVCPLRTHFYCPADSSGTKTCISRAQLCDFTNDCWDGSDEIDCDNYTRCDFNDTKICGWLQAKNDQMDWTRHKRSTPSIYTGMKMVNRGSTVIRALVSHECGPGSIPGPGLASSLFRWIFSRPSSRRVFQGRS